MNGVFEYADYHRTIIGYHGTTIQNADKLVDGEPFSESDNDDEWFGRGIYFWEHAPKQAWWWANRRTRKGLNGTPAVIGAVIRLGNCFDLLDAPNVKILKTFGEQYQDNCKKFGIEMPRNFRHYKNRDCAVFNFLYEHFISKREPIDSARGVYVSPRAGRIWEASWLYEDTHIQTCIRNPKNILAVWHVQKNG